MTECQKQILITNYNKHEEHKQKPDKTQNMTVAAGISKKTRSEGRFTETARNSEITER